MEIPIQHDVYIWANYFVSSYLRFIPICWNVLIWLKYDFMHIFMHHLSLYFETTAQIPEVEFGGDEIKYSYHIFCCNMFVFACPIIAKSQCWVFAIRGKYPYWPSNIRICPQISVFALIYPYLPPNSTSQKRSLNWQIAKINP
jgi:hypothetical protein